MAPRRSWILRTQSVAKDVLARPPAGKPLAQPVKKDVDHRGGVEREKLADEQSADHGDAQRTTQLGAKAATQRERKATEQGRHGGHHDGAKTEEARFVNRVGGALAVLAFGFEREIDDHDAVLLDDADEQDDADKGD